VVGPRARVHCVPEAGLTRLAGARVTIMKLGDIVEVLPGLSTGSALRHDPNGTHQVVLSKHLTPGLPYRFNGEDDFRIDPRVASATIAAVDRRARDTSRYELNSGDILFMSRGTRNLATVIESVPEAAIAPVSFFILRAREPGLFDEAKIDPHYLAWWLNTGTAQAAISGIRTGAGTPIVQRAAFSELAVPVPDLATQRHLAKVGQLAAREQQLVQRLDEARRHMTEAFMETIANRLLAAAHGTEGEAE